ncbi:MAG: oxidoreductase, partial [Pseudomonadota bacterium]
MVSAFSLSFLAPVLLVVVAILAFRQPGRRPGRVPHWSEYAATGAMALAAGGLIQVLISGPVRLGVGDGAAAFAIRADLFSLSMTLLVAFIGWVVMRYSRTYLDGEAREGAFHGLMLGTLAAVMVFVQAASLWVLVLATLAVGLGLKRLMLFYPERAEARRAAAKFGLVWH